MRFAAQSGVRGIGIGGAEYVVGSDGTVDVPDEFAAEVLANGFALALDAPAVPVAPVIPTAAE